MVPPRGRVVLVVVGEGGALPIWRVCAPPHVRHGVDSQDDQRRRASANVNWVVVSTFNEQRYRGDFNRLSVLTSEVLAQTLRASV